MSEPICLIQNTGDQILSVNEEAKKILDHISQPLVVVSIVGPYRSGKSYLLNKLSVDSKGGFFLGHTLSANTKGIWMRCIPHPKRSGHTLILLDTEGVGDIGKADLENDGMILSLAMLMSSAVIYNSKGAMDQDAVKKLHSMTQRYQYITQTASRQDAQTDDGEDTLPLLVWTLRDVTLRLEIDGRPVTANEYLENSLRVIKSVKTIKTQEQNKARTTIRKCFPKRKCFVFEIPSSDKEVLSRMDQVPEEELQSRFVEETQNFCQFVLEEVPAKCLKGGTSVTGSRFAHLLQAYLDVVKKQNIGFLESSLSDMFVNENSKVMKKSIEIYENKMSSQHVNSGQEFQQVHEAAVEEAAQEFRKSYVKQEKSQEEYWDELKDDLLKKKNEIWTKCEESSMQRCNEIKGRLERRLQQNLKENKYHVPGGHKAFISDKEAMLRDYSQEEDKGVKAEDVLQDLLSLLASMEKAILKTLQDVPDAAPKIFQVTDGDDDTQLTRYIQSYQLPRGPFSRVLIQLFGFAGHGKSSFVNSCLFVLNNKSFEDAAGEGTSQGGKTMKRMGYQLTDCITIVDNRGFSKMDSAEKWEIYAQLYNLEPLNESVSWQRSPEERINRMTKRAWEETSDVIAPVLIYSSQRSLSGDEYNNIKVFLKEAQTLTGIVPVVVLTHKTHHNLRDVRDKFEAMDVERIFALENFTPEDHLKTRGKHEAVLKIFLEVIKDIEFRIQRFSDPEEERQRRKRFVCKYVYERELRKNDEETEKILRENAEQIVRRRKTAPYCRPA
ncbi:GTPase activity, partial [Pristimantis euphronides]